ncbi:TonB-dependent receptor [Oceanicaulis sp.]|uniref:TonB-dependent receptor n=1 Tax=Oceanicaulis sp. TaxID=1924941 RepID=UPI003F7308CA
MNASIALRLAGISLAALSAVNSAPALAQSSASEDVITVTGSRILRTDLTSVGPLTVLDADFIDHSGVVNLEDLLQAEPFSAGFAGNANNAYWVGGGWGTAQVNLRGLGVNRTLILLNGRRIVAGGSGANDSVDLNMLPVSILERAEILKDGASALYGADAVAGVVNLITRQDFDGFQIEARTGVTGEGDGEQYGLDASWGGHTERGGLLITLSYQDNQAAPLSPRAPCALADSNGDGQLTCTPGSSSTAGGRAVLPNGDQINFIGGDAYEPFSLQAHGFNSNPYFNASNPVERLSFSAFGDYEINEAVSVFTEVLFNWRSSTQPASPATLRDIAIAANHPTNPTGEDLVVLRRRTTEFGARTFEQDVESWRVVTGLEGVLAGRWSYDLALNWGRNTATDALLNNINTRRFAQTLDPNQCGANGVPCADILGEGDLTAEVGDYVLVNQRDTGGNEQVSLTGNLSGTVMQAPAGPVGVAVGFEIREDKGWLEPDSLLIAGDVLGNAQDPIRGSIEAREAYAELNLPLVRDLPFADYAELNAAVRYSDYDLFGGDTNYKLGLNWQVIAALKLRGTYSTAFRTPSVRELFSGVSQAQLPTTDPCSNYGALDPSSVIYQNCQAAGVPLTYQQFGSIILTNQGGNPDLEPETATTFTAGVVVQPAQLPGLSLTLDYFDIEIEDAIRQTSGSAKLASCYTTPGFSHPFCASSQHTRNPLTGDVNFLSAQSANTGDEQMRGLDFALMHTAAFGRFESTFQLKASYLIAYETQAFEGDTPFDFTGGVGCCDGGYPEWRGQASWTLSADQWGLTWNAQYIGEAHDLYGDPDAVGYTIDPVVYHDVQGRYRISETTELAVGIDNLFDQDAPFVQSWSDGNTDTLTYSLLGRFFYARARLSF